MDYKDTLNLPKTRFPMKANLANREPEMLKFWDAFGIYHALLKKDAPNGTFILHDGPPYANGHLHLGHTVNKVLKDMIIKAKSMEGYKTPYVPGWDCHGLPIEHNVEKELGKKRFHMDQLEIRARCRAYAERFVGIQRDEFKRLGVLGDWANPYLTMTYDYEAAIAQVFCEIFLKGLVKKRKKPVYWCPTCHTALAEAEVEYHEHESPSITVRFPASKDLLAFVKKRLNKTINRLHVLIWTTTPWTLPANLAVALHPDYDYVVVRVKEEAWLIAEKRLLPLLTALSMDQTDVDILGRFTGTELEGLHTIHPFIQRESVLVTAPYVTLDTGTGCVHTAPGHGEDDYETGLRYGLEIYSPVDDAGRFTKEVPEFEGKNIFKANPEIVALLKEKAMLLHYDQISHSYPHCWRCKRPVIFRATNQWFISMEEGGLREKALEAIDEVQWIPEWGKDRIRGMVEARPDWCISRQRAWGVPITVFLCKDCGAPYLDQHASSRIRDLFLQKGADAWFTEPVEAFLEKGARCSECGSEAFEKEKDILDVWFDSGVSHRAVLETREGLSFPADLYLEGSDQHRGWFQSALLTSVATRDKAPYRAVLTHGFVVDGQGKKMSKSVGNVIRPEKVIKRYGGELLRLWVSAEDYRDDIKISDEILKRLTEAYRKIRNTIRYLLGNLSDFDPKSHQMAFQDLEPLDRWALWRHGSTMERVKRAYDDYRFHVVFHQLYQFCTVDMSALYLDIIKDRLYCELKHSKKRLSAQTTLYIIAKDLLRLLSPILSFTAEEAWQHMPGVRSGQDSIFLESMPGTWSQYQLTPEEEGRWTRLWAVRQEVTKALEAARREKLIGLALDARVEVFSSDPALMGFIEENLDELRTITIVSQLAKFDPEKGGEGENVQQLYFEAKEVSGLEIWVKKALGKKCSRCWQWSEKVGEDESHPDVCPRCADVLGKMGI